METWKNVVGYEGLYEISNLGRVKSCARVVEDSRTGTKTLKEKLLTLTVDSAGYCKVTLQDQGRNQVWKVHRLVAEHFCEKYLGCDIVNHIDCNTQNNKSSNLEWTTPKGNTDHMHSLGRAYKAFGEENPACKLSEGDVLEILDLQKVMSHTAISKAYGVARQTVGKIINGKIRKQALDTII